MQQGNFEGLLLLQGRTNPTEEALKQVLSVAYRDDSKKLSVSFNTQNSETNPYLVMKVCKTKLV